VKAGDSYREHHRNGLELDEGAADCVDNVGAVSTSSFDGHRKKTLAIDGRRRRVENFHPFDNLTAYADSKGGMLTRRGH